MKKITTEEFIFRSKKVHGNKYDYSSVEYVNSRTKVKIICHKHGPFLQLPRNHVECKSECPQCANDKLSKKFSLGNENFLKRAKLKHNNKYNYFFTKYVNLQTKIKIVCPFHGEFKQTPSVHLKTNGCPKCKNSRGEKIITEFLLKNKIRFEKQKRFSDCKYLSMLVFDFYLPDYNLLVEFDGEQHYKEIPFFGGKEGFEKRKIRDNIKNEYILKNNISLLRLPYHLIEFNELESTLKHIIK